MLGVQLYSVRDDLSRDRDATLRRIADIGFGAVEPYDPLNDPAGFRAVADDLGLTVWSTHAPVLGERRDDILDAAGVLGLDAVIVPAVAPEQWADADGVARIADQLNDTAARAADRGLRIGYHNHWWELESRIDGRSALEALADKLAPEVILEVDVYWSTVGGEVTADLLGRLGDRVRYLHVKDGPAVRDAPMTAVGAGTVPITDILAAAPTAYRVVELDECATDMFDALAESHRYLTGLSA
ncbi:sugar phosphate isomerase/epimerase family protein [Actinocatenispora rupis]|uniref:Xylose isomerase n=1 Tax=Actinocatenispora rupis TaxID=519421 RepID=A0A8J3JAG3_9ACTN|nr:sugar phosphate isomerase/epimerase [Actinocatenispora rupis]GID14860.1 xylose isomerase [Actinocatenispora rupis]